MACFKDGSYYFQETRPIDLLITNIFLLGNMDVDNMNAMALG